MLTVIVYFYALILGISLIHLAVSAVVTARRMKQKPDLKILNELKSLPRISILKPLKGIDDNLELNLRSFFELDYPDYELIFGLQNTDDPALPIVNKLMMAYPGVNARIVVENSEIGLNPKINNLHNMEKYIRGRYVLISDSNTQVKPEFLNYMLAAILKPDVGLVTATIRGIGAKKLAAIFENLHINTYVSPNVFVADALSGIPVVIGKSILISTQLLKRMGGFKAFKNFLAEDYLLGLKTKSLGLKVSTIPIMVDNVNIEWSLKRFINRHTRWAKIRRNMHIHHYFIESVSNPIALAVILALLLHNALGAGLLLLVTLVKMAHDIYLSRLMKSDLKWYHFFLTPVKDLLISILWFVPFISNTVNWRDNYFKIGKRSELRPLFN
ncbi:glycosyl transferase family 2 [Caldithrix abyssi DSM 13497]|uniref:Ceramide glucosyltransferase n=1 Tax=Caldithrix abyssi DSM 13497 TaxID=880073 RepID=H1XNG7_CALAY|nr:ceramide glucosyltransferase [Caldithrix abyssi]APF18100.1 ceramide glucosyltransferase [Caldithrix abyssi DSM 13497]EHO42138.1 glycosyl transferase family 2 [Caldithrix abyssi DSM 13497]